MFLTFQEKSSDEYFETKCDKIEKRNKFVMRCAIWYYLYNFRKVKNTYGGVLILVKLQASRVDGCLVENWKIGSFTPKPDLLCVLSRTKLPYNNISYLGSKECLRLILAIISKNKK